MVDTISNKSQLSINEQYYNLSHDQYNQNVYGQKQGRNDLEQNNQPKKFVKYDTRQALSEKKAFFEYHQSKKDLNYNHGKNRTNFFETNVSNKENLKRQDNSLSILTRRFMKQIRSEPNQTIDLNQVSTTLGVQKRRIYDITNVLEGINYVKKVSKNKLKWIGPHQQEGKDNRIIAELEQLTTEEMLLDRVIGEFQDKIKNLKKQQEYFCYFDCRDIQQLGKIQKRNEKTIIIQAPKKSIIQIKDFHRDVKQNIEIQKNDDQLFESVKNININSRQGTSENTKKGQSQSENNSIKVFQVNQISSVNYKRKQQISEYDQMQDINLQDQIIDQLNK